MSFIINAQTKLSDIILADPSTVTVLNRFGIFLGVGDHTVETVCQAKKLDMEFFATILNTYLNENYFPEKIMSGFRASTIVEYLNKTNQYYQQFQLPNIERHFHLLISKSDPGNNNLSLMLKFFLEVKSELNARIADDQSRWFPELLSCERRQSFAGETAIDRPPSTADAIEDKIDDLLSMLVVHLQGDYDPNLCLAVLVASVNLKKDITQNNRIRYRILKPMARALTMR